MKSCGNEAQETLPPRENVFPKWRFAFMSIDIVAEPRLPFLLFSMIQRTSEQ